MNGLVTMSACTSIYLSRHQHNMPRVLNRNRYAIRREEGRLHERIQTASAELMGRTVRLVLYGAEITPEQNSIIIREHFIGQVIGWYVPTGELRVRFGDDQTGVYVWLETRQVELVPP